MDFVELNGSELRQLIKYYTPHTLDNSTRRAPKNKRGLVEETFALFKSGRIQAPSTSSSSS